MLIFANLWIAFVSSSRVHYGVITRLLLLGKYLTSGAEEPRGHHNVIRTQKTVKTLEHHNFLCIKE